MSLQNWSCCYYCFLPLLLSDTATLNETKDKDDTNVPHCIQSEGNPLEESLEAPALSGYVGFFFFLELTAVLFVLRPTNAFTISLFFRFFVELVPCKALLLLFSFFLCEP